MSQTPRTLPIILAGLGAFIGLYATQPILPLLAGAFHAGKVMASLTVTLASLGVAVAAPFVGQVADRLGRKRVIVFSAFLLGLATLLNATAPSLIWLLIWRFVQGLATPGVFAVTTAYVQEEWPANKVASTISAFIGGNVMGGFSGRIISGFTAERVGWQGAFIAVGTAGLAIAVYLAVALPVESKFVRHKTPIPMLRATLEHLRNRQLLASYGIGFCVLFSLLAMFTWVTFHLAAPPFSLGAGLLGSIFVTYLAGAGLTPLAGRYINEYGHRRMLMGAAALAGTGVLITLGSHLWMVVAGLAIGCSGVFISQAIATSYVTVSAKSNRALAVGLYVSFYYTGGSFGAAAPGWLWEAFGWPGCVALVLAVQLVIAGVAWAAWSGRQAADA